MCKVLMIAGIKKDHVPQVEQFVTKMSTILSRIDEDGVGYAAITSQGHIYGEKWLKKDDAFKIHRQPPIDPIVEKMDKMFGPMLDWTKPQPKGKIYDSFGPATAVNIQDTVALMLHTRKATSGDKVIENVHPFVKSGSEGEPTTALIHNGQILNHDKLTKQFSTCDSEVILHEYLANCMYHNPWGIEQLAKTLVGVYTVGVLTSRLEGETWMPVLDIFKSNKELYVAYVKEWETFVYCTADWALTEGAKDMNLTLENVTKLKDGFYLRIDAITGEVIDTAISFTTSAQFLNGSHNTAHNHSAVKRYPPAGLSAIGPALKREDDIQPTGSDEVTTMSEAKKHFERRHPSLFTVPYVEPTDLTPEERALYDELEKDKKTDHKALHLVSVALNAKRA